jgi:hypothetical protein
MFLMLRRDGLCFDEIVSMIIDERKREYTEESRLDWLHGFLSKVGKKNIEEFFARQDFVLAIQSNESIAALPGKGAPPNERDLNITYACNKRENGKLDIIGIRFVPK